MPEYNPSGNDTVQVLSWHGSEAHSCLTCTVLRHCLAGNDAALRAAAMACRMVKE